MRCPLPPPSLPARGMGRRGQPEKKRRTDKGKNLGLLHKVKDRGRETDLVFFFLAADRFPKIEVACAVVFFLSG